MRVCGLTQHVKSPSQRQTASHPPTLLGMWGQLPFQGSHRPYKVARLVDAAEALWLITKTGPHCHQPLEINLSHVKPLPPSVAETKTPAHRKIR